MNEQLYSRLQLQHAALLKYSKEILLLLSREGTILETSQQAAVLFQQELVGTNIKDLFDDHSLSMESFISREVVQTMHLHCSPGRGVNLSLLLTFVPLVHNQEIDEMMVIGRDLREKENLEKKVEELEMRREALESERNVLREKLQGGGKTVSETTRRELENAMQKLEEVNSRFTRELEMASLLQHSLVPKSVLPNKYLRTAFYFRPMQMVGGDFYDAVDLGNQRQGVFIADVSGHGISSALIAAMLKISFHNYARLEHSPAQVLDKLNREYCRVIQTGDYLTAFYMILDPRNGVITYCGAGHPDALLRKKNNQVIPLSSEGFFIGMFENAEYQDATATLEMGDLVLAFTDGIIEAFSDRTNTQYGKERLRNVLSQNRRYTVENLLDAVISDFQKFMEGSSFFDDLAMVAVAYPEKEQTGEAE